MTSMNTMNNDRIAARDDATLMHILTHGFSDLRGSRRSDFRVIAGGTIKRVGRIGRTERGWWHKDTADMSAERERRQAATKRADDALLAQEIRDLFTLKSIGGRLTSTIDKLALQATTTGGARKRSSKRPVVMREVEVMHVKEIAGVRRVVRRENVQVVCKRGRQN